MDVVVLKYKGVNQEAQFIGIWTISAMSYELTTDKCYICLGINTFRIRPEFSLLIPPSTMKGHIPVKIHGAGIIFWVGHGFRHNSFVIYHNTLPKGTTTTFQSNLMFMEA